MQASLHRAITDYQRGRLSLEQIQQQIQDEIKTPDGMRMVRSLLEGADPSLPRSVRELLVRFSTSPGGTPDLRASLAANSTASWPAGNREHAPTLVRGESASIGPGSVLGGRYRLVRELGRGGMGVVYLADGLVTLQPFAVKVLNSEFLQHPDAISMLREEARKSLAMRHPHIVGVYPLERDGEQYYLPMEYLEGKTLRELLDQDFARGIPVDQAWPIIRGAGAALAFAHDHGVIHSDLKPSNIFVTSGGRPRVLDFGIARALRDHRYFDTGSLGAMTAAYASCEMLANKPPDFRDDVYAFACVVYELLTGNHPFAGHTATEARSRRMIVSPVRALNAAQNALLRRGLAFNCLDRVPTIEEFLTLCGGGGANVGLGDPRSAPRLEVTFPVDAALRFCGLCGKELPEVARFCPGCGASTEVEAGTSQTDEFTIPGEYRPTTGKNPSRPSNGRTRDIARKARDPVKGAEFRRLPKQLIAFGTIATVLLFGLLIFYVARGTRLPPASVRAVPAPASGPVVSTPGPGTDGSPPQARSPGSAARQETTATVVTANNATDRKAATAAPVSVPSPAADANSLLAGFSSSASGAGISALGAASPAAEGGGSHPAQEQSGGSAHDEDIDHPPIGRRVSAFKLAPNSPTVDEACPYPPAAEQNGDTGTVVLLVYVAADGSATTADVESSSDSKVLDDAALECVEQKLHFVPKRIGGKSIGSWARLTFKWSFGE